MTRILSCAALLIACFSVGCSDARPRMAQVKGKVSYEGRPVEKGLIQFKPLLAGAVMSSFEIKDGEYEGKACVATSNVFISSPRVIGKRKPSDAADSPEVDETEEGIPAHYNVNTKLTVEVKPGENEFDFNLKKNLPPPPVVRDGKK